MKTSAFLQSVVLAAALASPAFAVMSLDPISSGTGVTITGSGAKANGPVELYKNGISQGWVAADGSGNFSFAGIDVTTGDEFHTTASQVWNFNTDGDAEGWAVAAGGTGAVASGVWTVTFTDTGVPPADNITLNLVDGGNPVIIDTDLTRVFEIRYRINGTFASSTSTAIFDPGSGFQFGPTWQLTGVTGQWVTSMVDFTITGGVDNTYTSTGSSIQLAPGANGFGVGSTLEVDYIRVAEAINWGFDNDGDFMNWVADANTTAAVAGGNLSLTNNIAGTNAKISGQFSEIRTSHFNELVVGIDANPTISPNLIDWQYFGSGPAYAGGGFQTGWTPVPGTVVETVVDLTGTPLFGSTWSGYAALNAPAGGFQPMFPQNASETALVDYIRLQPAGAFGPSPAVTAVSTVTDWELLN